MCCLLLLFVLRAGALFVVCCLVCCMCVMFFVFLCLLLFCVICIICVCIVCIVCVERLVQPSGLGRVYLDISVYPEIEASSALWGLGPNVAHWE